MGLPIFEGIKEGIKSVTTLIDDLHTSEEEKAKLRLAAKELDIRIAESQNRVNEKEAVHRSIFVAGWRPFAGWTCGLGIFNYLLVYPYARIIWPTAPEIDVGVAMTILTGMLGLGAYRTYEKRQGVSK